MKALARDTGAQSFFPGPGRSEERLWLDRHRAGEPVLDRLRARERPARRALPAVVVQIVTWPGLHSRTRPGYMPDGLTIAGAAWHVPEQR